MQKKSLPLVIVSSLLAITLIAAVFLFLSGKIGLISTNGKDLATYEAVCDKNMVADYNQAMVYQKRGDADKETLDTAAIASLKSTIERSQGSVNDPTCQTMRFWIAVYEEDYPAAKAASDNVKRLYDKGLYSDSNLINNQPISNYEGAMYSFSPAGKADRKALGD